jgi:hypothetical protein
MPSRGASPEDSSVAGNLDMTATFSDGGLADFGPVTGPPQSGSHGVGDVVHASETGGPVGWICTHGGAPGTWKPFGGEGGLPDSRPVAPPLSAAPIASKPPESLEDGGEDERLRRLFHEYLDARKSSGESVSHVTWQKFSRSIRKRYPEGGKSHVFRVVVRDDRVTVVARGREFVSPPEAGT